MHLSSNVLEEDHISFILMRAVDSVYPVTTGPFVSNCTQVQGGPCPLTLQLHLCSPWLAMVNGYSKL